MTNTETLREPHALLFPGQGSQAHGMGRNLAEAHTEAMELWKKAEKLSQLPLRALYWDNEDETIMADTRNLQPAITVMNLALWQHCAPHVHPVCCAGHSLGEFSALAACGALGMDDTLELVALRGRLMAEADPEHIGAMVAILRLPFEEVDTAVKEVAERTGKMIRVANRNTPGQFAVSGHREAVEDLVEHLKPNRAKAIPLAVSGAFHTPLMAEAAAEFSKQLDKLEWKTPKFSLYSNVTGDKVDEAEKIHSLVRRQMTSSVLWIDTVQNQWKSGVRCWLEMGPKGVLTRMVRPILSANNVPDAGYTTIHVANLEAATQLFS